MATQVDVLTRLYARLYGKPLIRNDLRGELVEEIVAIAREPEWLTCGDDWGASDLRHVASGARVQVKQSAALQIWYKDGFVRSPPRFSIKEKTGAWEGSNWVNHVSRNADIFIFGWHPRLDDGCDHRDPSQWQFYVVGEPHLPSTQSISLASLQKLSSMTTFEHLRAAVDQAHRHPGLVPGSTVPLAMR